MNENAQKGWKPYVIKIAIIAMSICYVFGPSHNEVNKLLHMLTHQLEMPENVISHSTAHHSNYEGHKMHTSYKSDKVHNHKLLSFLDSILKASDSERNQEDSILTSFKIDKHITAKKYNKNHQLHTPIRVLHLFSFTKQKIQKGFQRGEIEPPQFV